MKEQSRSLIARKGALKRGAEKSERRSPSKNGKQPGAGSSTGTDTPIPAAQAHRPSTGADTPRSGAQAGRASGSAPSPLLMSEQEAVANQRPEPPVLHLGERPGAAAGSKADRKADRVATQPPRPPSNRREDDPSRPVNLVPPPCKPQPLLRAERAQRPLQPTPQEPKHPAAGGKDDNGAFGSAMGNGSAMGEHEPLQTVASLLHGISAQEVQAAVGKTGSHESSVGGTEAEGTGGDVRRLAALKKERARPASGGARASRLRHSRRVAMERKYGSVGQQVPDLSLRARPRARALGAGSDSDTGSVTLADARRDLTALRFVDEDLEHVEEGENEEQDAGGERGPGGAAAAGTLPQGGRASRLGRPHVMSWLALGGGSPSKEDVRREAAKSSAQPLMPWGGGSPGWSDEEAPGGRGEIVVPIKRDPSRPRQHRLRENLPSTPNGAGRRHDGQAAMPSGPSEHGMRDNVRFNADVHNNG